jgi:hypothetical protein
MNKKLLIFFLCLSFYCQQASAYNQNGANILGGIVGSMIRNSQIAAAQNAWNAYDPYITQCINAHNNPNVRTLISQGVLPSDYRLSPIIQACQQQITMLRQQEASRIANAAAEQANRQAAESAERARIEAQKVADEESEAQRQRVNALFVSFQNKTVDSNDPVAALLNYSMFGSNSGSPDSFWAHNGKSSSIYTMYQKGNTLQEPVENIRDLDIYKINPVRFFVKNDNGSVIILSDGVVFSRCQSCKREDVQSRWISFFSSRDK